MANYDLTYEGSRVQGILDTGNSLKDAGYIFRGEATPSTVPGTPTERVAYIGGPGTYTNFGGSITVGAGCICVFKYTGSAWSNQVINTGLSDAISSAINSEATARSEADTALQSAINSEATTLSTARPRHARRPILPCKTLSTQSIIISVTAMYSQASPYHPLRPSLARYSTSLCKPVHTPTSRTLRRLHWASPPASIF